MSYHKSPSRPPEERLARWRLAQDAARLARASILYPEDRTGYETPEQMRAAHEQLLARTLRSYPGAKGDPIAALCMALRQAQSVIAGAQARQAVVVSQIEALAPFPSDEAAP